MDLFGLDLHIFVIKPKPNQTENQQVDLGWIDRIHY